MVCQKNKQTNKNLKAELSCLWKGCQTMCCMHWVTCPNPVFNGSTGEPEFHVLLIIINFSFYRREMEIFHTLTPYHHAALTYHALQQVCQDWMGPSVGFLSPLPMDGLPRAVRMQQLLSYTSAVQTNSALQLGIRDCSRGAYFQHLGWIPRSLKQVCLAWFYLLGSKCWDTGAFDQGAFLVGRWFQPAFGGDLGDVWIFHSENTL